MRAHNGIVLDCNQLKACEYHHHLPEQKCRLVAYAQPPELTQVPPFLACFLLCLDHFVLCVQLLDGDLLGLVEFRKTENRGNDLRVVVSLLDSAKNTSFHCHLWHEPPTVLSMRPPTQPFW